MVHRHASWARLTAPLLLLISAATVVAGCGRLGADLEPGRYRAVLEVPGGDLPFGLEVAREDDTPVLYLVNGAERIRVPDVAVADGRLTATMPGFQNTLTAAIDGDRLEGEVTLVRPGGGQQVLPFAAERGQTWRFFETPSSDNVDVSGRWEVTFTSDAGRETRGVAEFEQSFEQVTGTILTPTGDHRFLAGEARGDEVFLSCFDGARAYLYRLRVDEPGELVGEYWSGQTSHQRLRAVPNPEAALDSSPVATNMRDPADRLDFSFPDLDGRPVSLSDPRFAGKVVIVTLAGSWCPNCHDEAAFLVELHRRLRDQGLEVVALMFEYHGDFAQAADATRRFRDRFGIDYPTLIAGISDKQDAARALPQLSGVFAYPTTIWVDRSGRVRKIHAGFSGPATGRHYEELTREFTAFTEQLLAEPASQAPGDTESGGSTGAK